MNESIKKMTKDICDACATRHKCNTKECVMSEIIAQELIKKYQPKLEAKVKVFHSQHGKYDRYYCGHCLAHLGYIEQSIGFDPPNYCSHCGAKLTEVCDE